MLNNVAHHNDRKPAHISSTEFVADPAGRKRIDAVLIGRHGPFLDLRTQQPILPGSRLCLRTNRRSLKIVVTGCVGRQMSNYWVRAEITRPQTATSGRAAA